MDCCDFVGLDQLTDGSAILIIIHPDLMRVKSISCLSFPKTGFPSQKFQENCEMTSNTTQNPIYSQKDHENLAGKIVSTTGAISQAIRLRLSKSSWFWWMLRMPPRIFQPSMNGGFSKYLQIGEVWRSISLNFFRNLTGTRPPTTLLGKKLHCKFFDPCFQGV